VPILTHLTFLDLYTVEVEDVSFLEHILNCMPNLIQFTITFMLINKILTNIIDVLDGQFWEELLSRHAPRLCKFDFFISVIHTGRQLVDLDDIVDSFEYFLTRYDGWHMAASRWLCGLLSRSKLKFDYKIGIYLNLKFLEQKIHLRTLNYSNKLRYTDSIHTDIVCGTFEMRSTIKIIDDCDHNFYSHNKHVEVFMSTYANSRDMFTVSTLPFRCVTYLIIGFENRMFTWLWNKLMKLG
jgi:hypothetical protein